MLTATLSRSIARERTDNGSEPPRSAPGRTDELCDFGLAGWLVRPSLDRMERDGVIVRIRPQLMDVLVCLSLRAGKVVTRRELLLTVWGGRFVAESALGRCVAELRRALGDNARHPAIIETINKRGYRLIVPVVVVGSAPLLPTDDPDTASGNRPVAAQAVVGSPPRDRSAHGFDHLRRVVTAMAARLSKRMWTRSAGNGAP